MFLQPLLCVPSSDAPSGIPLGAEGAEDVRWQADAIQAQTGPFLVHFLTLGQFYHGYFSPRWHTETWWDHMTVWGQQRAVPHGELLLQVQVVPAPPHSPFTGCTASSFFLLRLSPSAGISGWLLCSELVQHLYPSLLLADTMAAQGSCWRRLNSHREQD